MKKRILSAIICLLLAASPFSVALCAADSAASEVAALIDSAVSFKVNSAGACSAQELIDTSLSKTAGTSSQWYVLALRQYEKGYDFSAYAVALQGYVSSTGIDNAVTRQRCALTLVACGYTSSFVTQTVNDSIGELGIMSRVFGLHLINNGFHSAKHTADDVISSLLSLQLADGGWAVSGSSSDVDATAMVLQALAPHAASNAQVKNAVNTAIDMLSSRQLASGNFKSYGVENPESTAQVITALSALGINCLGDSRFIKNGNGLLDGLKKFRLSDGSFCHEAGGAYNNTATFQSLYALVALWRNISGYGSFYLFPHPHNSFSDAQTTQAQVPITSATERTTASAAPKTTAAAAGQATIPERTTAAARTTVAATTKKNISEVATAASSFHPVSQGTVALASTASQRASTVALQTASVAEAAAQEPSSTSAKAAEAVAAKRDNKKIAVIAVWAAALLAAAVIFACGKRKAVNFIAVAVVAAVLTMAVTTLNFESKGSFYSPTAVAEDEETIVVTLSINCCTIAGKSDKDYIPPDGIILNETQFSVSEGSTVFDVLMLAAKQYRIQVENAAQTGEDYSTAYISGINYIYEFDYGDLSGWMYHVNGSSPSVGCGAYTLADGDSVEWLYTCNLGDDLK